MARSLVPPQPEQQDKGRVTSAEGCFRGVSSAAAEAQSLWNALAQARADYSPRVLAAAEDAVFQRYLPWAQSLATSWIVTAVDPEAVEQAAELGLAQAVLGWRQPDSREFERYANCMITERLNRCCADPGTRRSSVRSPLPARRQPRAQGGTTPVKGVSAAGIDDIVGSASGTGPTSSAPLH